MMASPAGWGVLALCTSRFSARRRMGCTMQRALGRGTAGTHCDNPPPSRETSARSTQEGSQEWQAAAAQAGTYPQQSGVTSCGSQAGTHTQQSGVTSCSSPSSRGELTRASSTVAMALSGKAAIVSAANSGSVHSRTYAWAARAAAGQGKCSGKRAQGWAGGAPGRGASCGTGGVYSAAAEHSENRTLPAAPF